MDCPAGAPAIRVLAMPADTNPSGDIFGGWLLSQMDIAGATVAVERSAGRVVTIAVEGMSFLKPVHVGDLVSFYAVIEKTGRTSIRVRIDAWAKRGRTGSEERVTEGVFTYVAIDEDRRARPLPNV
ncbi:MAG: acyl-CoA thioesterase [Elstera sp.]|jgi:acyl-CoA thioesterase YciA|uniref:acyl-CoA thioesterase n=1 Tax=Elstera sp. TaxID=1916664 RepID=UPI0037C173E8